MPGLWGPVPSSHRTWCVAGRAACAHRLWAGNAFRCNVSWLCIDRWRAAQAGLQCACGRTDHAARAKQRTFLRYARTRGSGANRHLCSNAAGAARPGTLGGRTTRLGIAVWRCTGAGAVCACDLGRTLMISDAKGEESRPGDFRLVRISESTIGKKTCKMDHISSPDNAPSNGIRAFRRLPAGWHSSQGTPRANPTGREHSSSRRLMLRGGHHTTGACDSCGKLD